jgi:uncharacterized membrane protein
MADHDPFQHPRIAIALLGATALVSIVAVVINLGRDSLGAIAATLGVASALTLIAFITRSNRE